MSILWNPEIPSRPNQTAPEMMCRIGILFEHLRIVAAFCEVGGEIFQVIIGEWGTARWILKLSKGLLSVACGVMRAMSVYNCSISDKAEVLCTSRRGRRLSLSNSTTTLRQ